MKTNLKLLLIMMIATIVGCSQNSANVDTTKDSKQTFVFKHHNYSIQYPIDWTVVDEVEVNAVSFVGPQIDSAAINKDGAFGVIMFDLPEAFTSEQTCEKNMENFKTDPNFQDFKINSKTEILIDGKKAVRVIFSAKVYEMQVMSLQYYLAFDKKLYILGGSIPSQMLGKYEAAFDDMVKTMKFK